MNKLLELKGYVNQIQLKKVWFGGYSREDVQIKIDAMMEILEKTLEEQKEKEAEMMADFEKQQKMLTEELENKKRVSDLLVVDLNKSLSDMTEERTVLIQEQTELAEANRLLMEEKAELEVECERLRALKDSLTEKNASLKEEYRVLAEEKNQILEENHQMIEEQVKMHDAYRAYCGEIVKEYSKSLRSLSGEFSKILEDVSDLQREIDEDSVFLGLENALRGKEPEVLTGTVE